MLSMTQKAARTLIKQEIGIPARNLEKLTAPDGVYAYRMDMGGLSIQVENDRYTHAGRYALKLLDRFGGTMVTMLFYPETLHRDFGAENAAKSDAEQGARRDWVLDHGPDYCHKMVDRYWAG